MNAPKTYCIDIETAGQPLDKLTPPQFKVDSRLKDPAKIEASQAEKLAEWQGQLALHAETCTILAAGAYDGKKASSADGDETGVIKWIWNIIEDTPYPVIVGHNLRNFDLPVIMRRSWILGIKVPAGIMAGRFLNPRFRDTMEWWACGTRDMISLDNLAKALGVGAKTGKGGDFAALYATDKASAMEYLFNDVKLTWAVAERMGLT